MNKEVTDDNKNVATHSSDIPFFFNNAVYSKSTNVTCTFSPEESNFS